MQVLTKAKLEQFNSILYVLAASIDARDFLTAGHSEKVMEFSIGICNELGLAQRVYGNDSRRRAVA
jgi:HD-GYP domain-containing protein (c-di-GMP phosphodiesterase class II)